MTRVREVEVCLGQKIYLTGKPILVLVNPPNYEGQRKK